MFRSLLIFSISVVCGAVCLRAANTGNMISGDFEAGTLSYNRWAGVDDQGDIHVITGTQDMVNDNGHVGPGAFSPSVAIGDLNGDGLPDLVVGDSRGFFWYFPNSGKANAPVFTHGEVIPIWLGGGEREGPAVPRLQLIDYTGERKLSIVAGNFLGGLYYFHNIGSPAAPIFNMPVNRADLSFPTHTDNLLWCNYMSPFLYDWSGTGRLDLLMGDGTYSANSIYLFKNLGSNDQPVFNEKNRVKVIPGMGREQLTPGVVDWNNDGKPDVICGERSGYIDVYLNQAADKTSPPVFDKDKPIHVMFGTTEKVGAMTTVCAADLNHDNLFDLVLGSADGRIVYAPNIGTPGSPKFGALQPLKGVNPFPKIIKPVNWYIDSYHPDGAAYELLECTNPTVEPTFKPPPAPFKGKGAMKFSVMKPDNVYFKQLFQQPNNSRAIIYQPGVSLQANTRYTLSMWVRTSGELSNLVWHIEGVQGINGKLRINKYTGATISTGENWAQVQSDMEVPGTDKETDKFSLRLIFDGDGTLYMDDISLKPAQ